MTPATREYLYTAAERQQTKTDPAHDFGHVKRVVATALYIAQRTGDCNRPETWADEDIVEAAALFHDSIMYRKDTEHNKNASEESALFAKSVLKTTDFPSGKIDAVMLCIRECSFSKNIIPSTLESKIVFDADMLDATGAFGIMRTFAYAGMANVPFYNVNDPFCENGTEKMRSGLDHFYDRLLLVEGRMNTYLGKRLAKRRTQFLQLFIAEVRLEIDEIE